jgi:hypothetical protein
MKYSPLSKLRKSFDIITIKKTPKTYKSVGNDATGNLNMVEVPISLGFNWNSLPIGRVYLTKEAAELCKKGMILAPSSTTALDGELLGFGLVNDHRSPVNDSDRSVAEKIDKPANSFLWHLFLIAVVAGLLAIIILIIRLFYVKV